MICSNDVEDAVNVLPLEYIYLNDAILVLIHENSTMCEHQFFSMCMHGTHGRSGSGPAVVLYLLFLV